MSHTQLGAVGIGKNGDDKTEDIIMGRRETSIDDQKRIYYTVLVANLICTRLPVFLS